jgi:hypothetical protein
MWSYSSGRFDFQQRLVKICSFGRNLNQCKVPLNVATGPGIKMQLMSFLIKE